LGEVFSKTTDCFQKSLDLIDEESFRN